MRRAVAAIIQNNNNQILLLKRGAKTRNESGFWENIGGGIDGTESPEEAIIRECKEEIGTELINLRTLFVTTSDSEGQRWEVTVFTGKIKGEPAVQEPEKCLELQWVSANKLSNLPLASYTKADFVRLGWISH